MTAQIQFIGTSPQELAEFVTNSVKTQFESLIKSLNHAQENPKELMTRKETAELFSVSLVTIHEWVNTGILRPYKVGNRTFFKRSECLQVVEQSNPTKA